MPQVGVGAHHKHMLVQLPGLRGGSAHAGRQGGGQAGRGGRHRDSLSQEFTFEGLKAVHDSLEGIIRRMISLELASMRLARNGKTATRLKITDGQLLPKGDRC